MCKKFLGKRGVKATVLILFLFLCTILFAQKGQIDDDKKLREEILTIFKSKGEVGLRDFLRSKKGDISNKFIVKLAIDGYKERNKRMLKISEIMAKEKKDEKTIAESLYRTGKYFSLISDNKKAMDYFDRALLLFKKTNALQRQGNVYFAKGSVYYYTGDKFKALEMYDNALAFFMKTGRSIGQGNVFQSKGLIYFEMGDNKRAIEMFDKALPLFKKGGSLIGQGNLFICKGNIYLRAGDNTKAIEMYDKALPFFEKTGEPLGQGNVRMWKGDIYLRTGKYSRAIEMYDKALPFYEEAKRPMGQGHLCLREGDIYLITGDKLRALKMYNKAQIFYSRAEDPIGQGMVYARMGDIYFQNGENLKASEMYDNALPIFEKNNDPIGQGNIYMKRGYINIKIGKNSKALNMFNKALSFFEKAEAIIGKGYVYSGKGEICYLIGDNLNSLDRYNKALLFFEKSGDIKSESNALHGKAKVLLKMGDKEKALALFEKGIACLEKVRRQTAFSDMKRTFLGKVYDQYEEVAVFMINNNFYKKAFKYTESMKARVFLDRLAEGLVRLDKGISPELKQKRDNLVSKLSILSKEIDKAVSADKKKKWKELKEEYRKVEEKFKELLVKIRLENPLYASVKYPEPVSVQDLQSEVLKKKELLLRYFVTSHKVYVFLISKTNFDIFILEINSKSLKEMVNKYLLALKLRNTAEVTKYGKFLYMKLFKPLEKLIKRRKNLIIIPDGELAKIPFESFVIDIRKSGKPVYLVNKYRVKYVQSATVLSVLRRHYRKEGTTKHFIGFGDPVYDYENFKKGESERSTFRGSTPKGDEIYELHRSRFTREGGVLNRLQASGQEVTDISKLFKKKKQKYVVYLRKQANENNAKSPDLNEFDYIHFSCHGILGDGFQSLVLSQIPESSEDGYLTLNEIMNCNYNARLVVLSACQTGSGKLRRGEGVTGLTRAVMYAGSPAVVASLWKVDDIGTKELMVRFYRNMVKKRMKKEEALRKAKLELIEIERYSSPFYWSAFVMYGE